MWIPAMPDHWRIVPGASVLKPVGAKNVDLLEPTVLSLSYGKVIVKPPEKLRGLVPESFETYQILQPGDIVVRPTDLQNDKTSLRVGLVHDRGIITSAYLGLRATGIEPTFAFSYLAALDNMKIFYGMGSGLRQNLDFTDFKRLPVPIPPTEEQAAIVKYLGHAHARVDRAIAAKRKLIALLEEQKQAITYQAVTRGLDPSVTMKDSGIPWLGEVPSHWELTPTRAALQLTKVVVGEGHTDHVLLSLTLGGVIVRDLENLKGKFSTDQSTYQLVTPGQFVFCLFDVDETPRTIGLSSVHGMITGAYRVFDCSPQLADYVELYFLAMDSRKSFRPLYTGLRKTIPVGALMQSKMPFPPREERAQIVEQVRAQRDNIDQLKARTSREMELLREFRARLTADVVTGQVDVQEIAVTLPEMTGDVRYRFNDESGDDDELFETELDLASADE